MLHHSTGQSEVERSQDLPYRFRSSQCTANIHPSSFHCNNTIQVNVRVWSSRPSKPHSGTSGRTRRGTVGIWNILLVLPYISFAASRVNIILVSVQRTPSLLRPETSNAIDLSASWVDEDTEERCESRHLLYCKSVTSITSNSRAKSD
jgi:hypothetical protein